MSQYLDLFIQESDEQLEILEQETLKLEDDPADERLQVIFRAAHTLKGSSRAMGFSNFAELTHEMENLLDQLRGHTLTVNTEIADALLECIDTLGQMASSIGAGNGDNVDCKSLVETLQAFHGLDSPEPQRVSGAASANPDGAWVSQVQEEHFEALKAASATQAVFHAQFRLQTDCVMKYVRAFMAISIVQESGEILVCCPEIEDLEEEKFDLDFEIVFQSNLKLKDLKKKLAEISEIEKFTVKKWDEKRVKKTADQAAKIARAQKAAAPPPTQSTTKKPAAKASETGQTVRVDVARLDNLMNLIGELVIDRTRISQIVSDLATDGHDENVENLAVTVSHIGRITSDLQDQIMKARMLPIETVFNRFPRVVRDLAKKLNKEVNLELVGGETELDRSVIEIIGDPLLHILRNSVDHGLEPPDEREELGKPRQGTVTVSARHEENHIVIEIVDDGKGIDLERIKQKAIDQGYVTAEEADRLTDREIVQFVFKSGLSTVEEVSEVSGRGVGMDIVRSNIQKVGGIIDLETTPGQGTHFSLRLPLTLAIIRGLLVSIWDNAYVLPLGSVVETLLMAKKQIQTINGHEVIVIRGVTMPLVSMRDVFMVQGRHEAIVEVPQEEVCEELADDTTDQSPADQVAAVEEDAGQPDDACGPPDQAPPLENETEPKPEQVEDPPTDDKKMIYVVVVGLAEQRIGLVVDNLIGEQEVVIKSLSRFCGDVGGVSGATILGDGNVALIVDVNGVAKVA